MRPGPEQRINGRYWKSVQEDIKRNPQDYIIQNNGNQKWLETRTGLVIWRAGTNKFDKVYTCNPGDKNNSNVQHCLDLVDALPNTTKKLLLERKITGHGTTTSLYSPVASKPSSSPLIPEPASFPSASASTSASAPPTPAPSVILEEEGEETEKEEEENEADDTSDLVSSSVSSSVTSESPDTGIKNPELQWLEAFSDPAKLLPGSRWSLEAIHHLSDKDFENEHDFVQVMMPNPTPGQNHNPQRPLLTDVLAAAVANSPGLREQALKNLDRMLLHWGISRDGETFQIIPYAFDQTDRWLPPPYGNDNNHNKQRITRTLIFLHQCGFPHAEGLRQLLQSQREANGWPRVDYWDEALNKAPISPNPAPEIIDPSDRSPASPADTHSGSAPRRTPPTRNEGQGSADRSTGATPEAPNNNSIILNPHPNHKPRQSHHSYTVPAWDGDGNTIQLTVQDDNYDQVREFLARSSGHPYAQRLNDKSGIGSENGAVKFYDTDHDARHGVNNEYLSNTHRHFQNSELVPLTFGNDPQPYNSVEQFFQARKFLDGAKEDADQARLRNAWMDVMSANSGGDAARRAHKEEYADLIDFNKWNGIKQDLMYYAILQKFLQNAELRQKLINTWPNVIIEDTSEQVNHIDDFWGSGIDNVGSNITGQILGRVREELMTNPQYMS